MSKFNATLIKIICFYIDKYVVTDLEDISLIETIIKFERHCTRNGSYLVWMSLHAIINKEVFNLVFSFTIVKHVSALDATVNQNASKCILKMRVNAIVTRDTVDCISIL